MKNYELASLFEELANLLEFHGENQFKVLSYRRASRVLIDLTEDITELVASGAHRELSGIGESIANKIEEYLKTGKIKRLEEARAGVPGAVLEIFRIPGVGPKRAMMLVEKLGVKNIDGLEKAAIAQKIRVIPGMGAKTEEAILRGIRIHRAGTERMLLTVALKAAKAVMDELCSRKGVVSRISTCGSLRRMCPTIGDVDILACGPDPAAIVTAFTTGNFVYEKLAAGETRASIVVKHGPQVDLRVVEPQQFGAALQYFTGSKEHNIKLRGLAKERGLKINEYGIFRGEKLLASKEEEDIYRVLGMPCMPPEIRENRGEIETALAGTLPKLVEEKDIIGDLHMHSNYSDGVNSIEQLAHAARERGLKYIAITDHSKSLHIANGLDEARLREQMKEIAALNKKMRGFKILTGTEMDIKQDGSLDFSDELLAELDVVIASVHSGFKQPREKIMKRLDAALQNPHVDIIGHPTGRLLNEREGYDVDVPELIRRAAATGTALEINANPHRLDLTDGYCHMAKGMGVKISIGTDAHYISEMEYMPLGVSVARRGWLEKRDILNTALPAFRKHKQLV